MLHRRSFLSGPEREQAEVLARRPDETNAKRLEAFTPDRQAALFGLVLRSFPVPGGVQATPAGVGPGT